MTGRVGKYIRVFLLYLAAAIFFAHMFVPHDHHAADSDAMEDHSCPVKSESHNHHSNFPVHCHAFNDLTSEKTIFHFIIHHIQFRDILLSSDFDSLITNLQLTCRIYAENCQPVYSFVPESSDLRAPPSAC